jgi:hypothetical protein
MNAARSPVPDEVWVSVHYRLMDIIAVNGGICVIEFIGCADAWGDGCWSGKAVSAVLVTR